MGGCILPAERGSNLRTLHARPLNLADRPWIRLITLCSLYVAQGIPFGFVTITLTAYLANPALGLGEAEIGNMTAMALLPSAPTQKCRTGVTC